MNTDHLVSNPYSVSHILARDDAQFDNDENDNCDTIQEEHDLINLMDERDLNIRHLDTDIGHRDLDNISHRDLTPRDVANSADAVLAAIYNKTLSGISPVSSKNNVRIIQNETHLTDFDTVPSKSVPYKPENKRSALTGFTAGEALSTIADEEPQRSTSFTSSARTEPLTRDKKSIMDYVNGLLSTHNSSTHSNGGHNGSSNERQYKQSGDVDSNSIKTDVEESYDSFPPLLSNGTQEGNVFNDGDSSSGGRLRRTSMERYQLVPLYDGIYDIMDDAEEGEEEDEDDHLGDERERDGRVSRIGSYGASSKREEIQDDEDVDDFNGVMRQVRNVIDADGGVDDVKLRQKLKEVLQKNNFEQSLADEYFESGSNNSASTRGDNLPLSQSPVRGNRDRYQFTDHESEVRPFKSFEQSVEDGYFDSSDDSENDSEPKNYESENKKYDFENGSSSEQHKNSESESERDEEENYAYQSLVTIEEETEEELLKEEEEDGDRPQRYKDHPRWTSESSEEGESEGEESSGKCSGIQTQLTDSFTEEEEEEEEEGEGNDEEEEQEEEGEVEEEEEEEEANNSSVETNDVERQLHADQTIDENGGRTPPFDLLRSNRYHLPPSPLKGDSSSKLMPLQVATGSKYGPSSGFIEEIKSLYDALDTRVNKLAENSNKPKNAEVLSKPTIKGVSYDKLVEVTPATIGQSVSVAVVDERTPINSNNNSNVFNKTGASLLDNDLVSDARSDTLIAPSIDLEIIHPFAQVSENETPTLIDSIEPRLDGSSYCNVIKSPASEHNADNLDSNASDAVLPTFELIHSVDDVRCEDLKRTSNLVTKGDAVKADAIDHSGATVDQYGNNTGDSGERRYVGTNADLVESVRDKLGAGFDSTSIIDDIELSTPGTLCDEDYKESIALGVGDSLISRRASDDSETILSTNVSKSSVYDDARSGDTRNNDVNNRKNDLNILDLSLINCKDVVVDLPIRLYNSSDEGFTSEVDVVLRPKTESVASIVEKSERNLNVSLTRDTSNIVADLERDIRIHDAKKNLSVEMEHSNLLKVKQSLGSTTSIPVTSLINISPVTNSTSLGSSVCEEVKPFETNRPYTDIKVPALQLDMAGRVDQLVTNKVIDVVLNDGVQNSMSGKKAPETWTFTTDYTFIIPTKPLRANSPNGGNKWASDSQLATAIADKFDHLDDCKKESTGIVDNMPLVVSSENWLTLVDVNSSKSRNKVDVVPVKHHARSKSADASVLTQLFLPTSYYESVELNSSSDKKYEKQNSGCVADSSSVIDENKIKSKIALDKLSRNVSPSLISSDPRTLTIEHKGLKELSGELDSTCSDSSNDRSLPSVHTVLVGKPSTPMATSEASENKMPDHKPSHEFRSNPVISTDQRTVSSTQSNKENGFLKNPPPTDTHLSDSLHRNLIDGNANRAREQNELKLIVKHPVQSSPESDPLSASLNDSTNKNYKYQNANFYSFTVANKCNFESNKVRSTSIVTADATRSLPDSTPRSENTLLYRTKFETPGNAMASTLINSMFSKSSLTLNDAALIKENQHSENRNISTSESNLSDRNNVHNERHITNKMSQLTSHAEQGLSGRHSTEKEKKPVSSPKLGRKSMTVCPVEIDIDSFPAKAGSIPQKIHEVSNTQNQITSFQVQQIPPNKETTPKHSERANIPVVAAISSSASRPVEHLKGILANARPRAPPSSFVESQWNGGALLVKAKSEGKSLHNLSQLELYSDKVPIWRGGETTKVGSSRASTPTRHDNTPSLGMRSALSAGRLDAVPNDSPDVVDASGGAGFVGLRGTDDEFRTKSLSDLTFTQPIPAHERYRTYDINLDDSDVATDDDDDDSPLASPRDVINERTTNKRCLSQNQLRVLDSLNNLHSIPGWYRDSLIADATRPGRSRNTTRSMMNLRSTSRRVSWASAIGDGGSDVSDVSSDRPVIIAHRVTIPVGLSLSNLQSSRPGATQFNTTRPNSTTIKFELPTAKQRAMPSPFRPIAIVPYEVIMGSKVSETPENTLTNPSGDVIAITGGKTIERSSELTSKEIQTKDESSSIRSEKLTQPLTKDALLVEEKTLDNTLTRLSTGAVKASSVTKTTKTSSESMPKEIKSHSASKLSTNDGLLVKDKTLDNYTLTSTDDVKASTITKTIDTSSELMSKEIKSLSISKSSVERETSNNAGTDPITDVKEIRVTKTVESSSTLTSKEIKSPAKSNSSSRDSDKVIQSLIKDESLFRGSDIEMHSLTANESPSRGCVKDIQPQTSDQPILSRSEIEIESLTTDRFAASRIQNKETRSQTADVKVITVMKTVGTSSAEITSKGIQSRIADGTSSDRKSDKVIQLLTRDDESAALRLNKETQALTEDPSTGDGSPSRRFDKETQSVIRDGSPSPRSDKGVQVTSVLLKKHSRAEMLKKRASPEPRVSDGLVTSSFNLQLSNIWHDTVKVPAFPERVARQVTSRPLSSNQPKSSGEDENTSRDKILQKSADISLSNQAPTPPQTQRDLPSQDFQDLILAKTNVSAVLNSWSFMDNSSKNSTISPTAAGRQTVSGTEKQKPRRSESSVVVDDAALSRDDVAKLTTRFVVQNVDQYEHHKKGNNHGDELSNPNQLILSSESLFKPMKTKKKVKKSNADEVILEQNKSDEPVASRSESPNVVATLIAKYNEGIVPVKRSDRGVTLVGKPLKISKNHHIRHSNDNELTIRNNNDIQLIPSGRLQEDFSTSVGAKFTAKLRLDAEVDVTDFSQVDSVISTVKPIDDGAVKRIKSKRSTSKYTGVIESDTFRETTQNIVENNLQASVEEPRKHRTSRKLQTRDETFESMQQKQYGEAGGNYPSFDIIRTDEISNNVSKVKKVRKTKVSGSKKVSKTLDGGEDTSKSSDHVKLNMTDIPTDELPFEEPVKVLKIRSKSSEPNFMQIEPSPVMLLPKSELGRLKIKTIERNGAESTAEQKFSSDRLRDISSQEFLDYNGINRKQPTATSYSQTDLRDKETEDQALEDRRAKKEKNIGTEKKREKSSRRKRDVKVDENQIENVQNFTTAESERGKKYALRIAKVRAVGDELRHSTEYRFSQQDLRGASDNLMKYESTVNWVRSVNDIRSTSPIRTFSAVQKDVDIQSRMQSQIVDSVSADRRKKVHKVRTSTLTHESAQLTSSVSESCIAQNDVGVNSHRLINAEVPSNSSHYADDRHRVSNDAITSIHLSESGRSRRVKPRVETVRNSNEEIFSETDNSHVSRHRRKNVKPDRAPQNATDELPFDVILQQLGLSETV